MNPTTVSYSADSIVFTNSQGRSESLKLMDKLDPSSAMKIIKREAMGMVSASQAAVSMLLEILTHDRFDEYKGTIAPSDPVPKQLKGAIREREVEVCKPLFLETLAKGTTPAQANKLWDDVYKNMVEGGSYAVAKSAVTKYFAITGSLPVHDGKILTIAAINKLIAIEKSKTVSDPADGISGRIVKLAKDLRERNEKTDVGSAVNAIAALREMLATYEGLAREMAEALTIAKGNIIATTTDALAKAAQPDNNQAVADNLTAQFENGMLELEKYTELMDGLGFEVKVTEPV